MQLISLYLLVLLGVTSILARPQEEQNQQQSTAQPIAIINQENVKSEDGSYKYNFETENGIRFQEEATFQEVPNVNIRAVSDGEDEDKPGTAIVARGSYQYIAPDGTPISLSYVADANGFQPVGDHLPTPPPIPEVIRRAIELLPQEYKGEQEEQ